MFSKTLLRKTVLGFNLISHILQNNDNFRVYNNAFRR